MAEYTVHVGAVTGTEITKSTPANGDTFNNDGGTLFVVENANGTGLTFDVVTTQVVETDLDVEDRTLSVAATATEVFGPFNNSIYSDTVTVQNWSATANVEVWAVKVS